MSLIGGRCIMTLLVYPAAMAYYDQPYGKYRMKMN